MPAEDCYGSNRMYCSNSELANTTLLFQGHGNVGQSSTRSVFIVFTFNKPLKQSTPRTQVKPLVLKAYTHDESLCVFSTLKEYLQRTETLRVTGSQLLISFQKPHKAVSRDTISRWIRTVMQLSGINLDVYKAHSTRAASVSAAHRAQVPVSCSRDSQES